MDGTDKAWNMTQSLEQCELQFTVKLQLEVKEAAY